MMHEGQGLGSTFDRGYVRPLVPDPQQNERTSEQKVAGAKTVADNFDHQLELVRAGVAAMNSTSAAGDLGGWTTAKSGAEQALQQLAHIAKSAPATVHEATDPDVRKRLARVDQVLEGAQQLVADAPAAPLAAAPELSCGDALLAALPPDPPRRHGTTLIFKQQLTRWRLSVPIR